MGEGGATLVLETLEHARARGAGIYAEVAGCGMSSDAHNMLQPVPAQAAQAIRQALDDTGLAPEDVAYINAHGTGTVWNDAAETEAIHSVFGAHAPRLLVSSTKSMHGHLIGGTGALEAVATVAALRTQVAPTTIGYLGPDPSCDLDYVPTRACPAQIDVALSHSFAFGGLNVALAFRRWPEGR